jgi:hypothetical protein
MRCPQAIVFRQGLADDHGGFGVGWAGYNEVDRIRHLASDEAELSSDHHLTPGAGMAGERLDTIAIMAAIIYAGRTGESGQAPNENVFTVVAKAAWDLHKAVLERGEGEADRTALT